MKLTKITSSAVRYGGLLIVPVLFLTTLSSIFLKPSQASATPITLPSTLLNNQVKGSGCDIKYIRDLAPTLTAPENRVGPLVTYDSNQYSTNAMVPVDGNTAYAKFVNSKGTKQVQTESDWDDLVAPILKQTPFNNSLFGLEIGGSSNCSYKMVAYPPSNFLSNLKSANQWTLFTSDNMFSGLKTQQSLDAVVPKGAEIGTVTVDANGAVTNISMNFNFLPSAVNTPFSNLTNIDSLGLYKTWLTQLGGGGSGGGGTLPPPQGGITDGITKITVATFSYFSAGQINVHLEGTTLYGGAAYPIGAAGNGIDLALYDKDPKDKINQYVTHLDKCNTTLDLGSQADDTLSNPKATYSLASAKSFNAQIDDTNLKGAGGTGQCATLVNTGGDSTVVKSLPNPNGAPPGVFAGYLIQNPISDSTYRRSQYEYFYTAADTIQKISDKSVYKKVTVPSNIGNGSPVFGQNGATCGSILYVITDPSKPWIMSEWDSQSGTNDCSDYKESTKGIIQLVLSSDKAVGLVQSTDPNSDTATPNGGVGDNAPANSCEASTGLIGVMLCPLVSLVSSGIEKIDTFISNTLQADVPAEGASQLKAVWVNLRNLAYIILVPIMLVMVIGTAIGIGPFDAYTVKKALPRILAAVIFIALSWYICLFFINLANVVGGGIKGLVEAPFGGNITLASLFDAGAESVVVQGLLVLPAIAAGLILLAFFLPTILLFLMITFGVVVLRRIFIIALLLVSPLAILSWVFPSNNKLWKAWWDSFSRLLMVYPLMMLLISVGHIFAKIINIDDNGGILNFLFKMAAYVLPLVFIPAAFKFAGGIFATISGMANDRGKGLFDRAKKGRADKFHRAQHGTFVKRARKGGWIDRNINSRASVLANANRLSIRNLSGSAHNIHRTHTIQQREEMLQDKDFIGAGDDEITRAMATSSGRQQFLDNIRAIKSQSNPAYEGSHDEKADLDQYDKLSQKYGTTALRSAALFRAIAGGTTMDRGDKGAISWLATAAEISGGDRSVLADLVGKGRSIATQAGKPLAGGMSHGTGMAIALSTLQKKRYTYNETTGQFDLDQQWAVDNKDREYNTQDAVLDSRRASWDQQSAASFFRPGVKLDDVRAGVGLAKSDIDDKIAIAKTNEKKGDEKALAKANRDVLKAFAQQDQMYQAINYATPEQLELLQPFFNEPVNVGELPQSVKDMLSKTQRFDGIPVEGTITRSQLLNDLHSTAEFQTTSKQFYGEAGLGGKLTPAQQAALVEAGAHAPEGVGPPPPPGAG